MKLYQINENGLHIVFMHNDDNELKLLHFSSAPWDGVMPDAMYGCEPFFPVMVKVTGDNNPRENHGHKHSSVSPGYRLKFYSMEDTRNEIGRSLLFTLKDPITDLMVLLDWQFFDGLPIVRCTSSLVNDGEDDLGIEYLSSFALAGRDWRDEDLRLHVPFHSWCHEMTWNEFSFADLGMKLTMDRSKRRSSQVIDFSNTGNWSAKNYLPMAVLEDTAADNALFWQIENNGSWHWEISDADGYLYLQVSGPDEHQNHWWRKLMPGESFTGVSVAVGCVSGAGAGAGVDADAGAVVAAGADAGVASPALPVFPDQVGDVLTEYRRRIRRPNRDDEDLPVIFNDYMNCLFGDPTAEKEYPMIDKAAEAGCEYYVIDAGWYADGEWWDGVGEWKESKLRFPKGVRAVTDYIRSKGMIPGLWLELEAMGINCPLANKLPDDWFFVRHGKRVTDRSRYQLDFRNPAVRAHADKIIDRIVNVYGAGYIKMDYNIDMGIGTTLHADSAGDGLLEHNRAYLEWLSDTFEKYPDLVIENCSSGGLRMDYAMLSLYPIQSTSDNEDYRQYPTIAANSPLALAPEQAAVWSYPLSGGDEEECVFNLVSAMLLRIHQSGHLANLDQRRFDLVKEGIACYKNIRGFIREAVPFWPIGLSSYGDTWSCFALKGGSAAGASAAGASAAGASAAGASAGERALLAVWRNGDAADTVELPMPQYKCREAAASVIFPDSMGGSADWDAEAGVLRVTVPHEVAARVVEVVFR